MMDWVVVALIVVISLVILFCVVAWIDGVRIRIEIPNPFNKRRVKVFHSRQLMSDNKPFLSWSLSYWDYLKAICFKYKEVSDWNTEPASFRHSLILLVEDRRASMHPEGITASISWWRCCPVLVSTDDNLEECHAFIYTNYHRKYIKSRALFDFILGTMPLSISCKNIKSLKTYGNIVKLNKSRLS